MPPQQTVLLVHPDPRARFAWKAALAGQYRVLEAETALAALAVCACRPVALLVTAVNLPDIAGPKLAEKFSHPFPEMPVLCGPAAESLPELAASALRPAAPRKDPRCAERVPGGRARAAPA